MTRRSCPIRIGCAVLALACLAAPACDDALVDDAPGGGHPDRLVAVARTLAPGDEISPVDLGDVLASAGYTRQDPVDESGEFCVRGGVVDFYPAGAEQPLRLEFIGDNIESIRAYDPATQRSTAALDRAAIVPLQELIPGDDEPDRSATVIDYFRAAGRPVVHT